jgi:hypothetical protein
MTRATQQQKLQDLIIAANGRSCERILDPASDSLYLVGLYRKARAFARRHGVTLVEVRTHGGFVPNCYGYRAYTTMARIDKAGTVTATRVTASSRSRRHGFGSYTTVLFALPEGDTRRGPDFPRYYKTGSQRVIGGHLACSL